MFRKLNVKMLLYLFGGLLILALFVKVIQHSKGDRNFKSTLFEMDTAKVSTIFLKPGGSKDEISIVRNGKSWNVVIKGKTYKADKNAIEGMLYELNNMKPDRVAATEKSDWNNYQVTDSASTRVRVQQKGKIVADFLVGKVSLQQYQQTSYVRVTGENEVYAVNGFLAMTFNKNADDFRDKTMVRITNPADITRLTFSYPDSSFAVTKENGIWKINGEKADSLKSANYVNSLSVLYGSDFVSDALPAGKEVFSLKVEGKNFQPIEIKAVAADTSNKYIITSNMNSEGRFSGAKGGLAKRIFVGHADFKPSSETGKKK